MSFINKHTKFFIALLIFTTVLFLASRINYAAIVETIGAQHIYTLTFVLAMIGGVSALSAPGFYAILFSFALGGTNPFLLAACAAPGVLLGDTLFWYIGKESKEVVRPLLGSIVEKWTAWIHGKPRWVMPLFVYGYTGLTPLPGDVLMVALAMLGYHFRQIFLPTLLGNFTLALIVGLSATYGLPFFTALL